MSEQDLRKGAGGTSLSPAFSTEGLHRLSHRKYLSGTVPSLARAKPLVSVTSVEGARGGAGARDPPSASTKSTKGV